MSNFGIDQINPIDPRLYTDAVVKTNGIKKAFPSDANVNSDVTYGNKNLHQQTAVESNLRIGKSTSHNAIRLPESKPQAHTTAVSNEAESRSIFVQLALTYQMGPNSLRHHPLYKKYIEPRPKYQGKFPSHPKWKKYAQMRADEMGRFNSCVTTNKKSEVPHKQTDDSSDVNIASKGKTRIVKRRFVDGYQGDDEHDSDEESKNESHHDMKGAEIQRDNLKRKRQYEEEEEDDDEIVFKPKRYKRV